ncbi:hypothetical protein BHM03_00008852 [Ensete ventricosum]|nr:hypothetical protein BHM03_00008852 [Ensete ventricosum]
MNKIRSYLNPSYPILGLSISSEYDLHVSEVGQRPFNPFANGFELLVDALEVGLRGWGFKLKWIDHDVDNSPPLLTKDDVEQVISYENGYRVALAHFWVRYLKLEIEEDPYTTLLEGDNMLIEV